MNIISPGGTKVWFTMKFTKYEQYNRCSRASKGISRAEQKGKKRGTDDQLLIHYASTASLWHPRSPSWFKLSGSRQAGPGIVRKQTNEYIKWSQVACTINHTCIDKSESKSIYRKLCCECRHTHQHAMKHQVKQIWTKLVV